MRDVPLARDSKGRASATVMVSIDFPITLSGMREQERPSYLPRLPLLYERTDYVPGSSDTSAAQAVPPVQGVSEPKSRASEREKNPRLQLSGARLATLPRWRQTPRNQLVCEMQIEVDDEHVVRPYTLLAFDKKAEALKGRPFALGMRIDCIGYLHYRSVRQPDGSTKQAREIYAVMLRASPPQELS